jgi:hypothetical protein
MVVEDADRLTEQACNALLKAIEEPTERTVWMLCAPTIDDVLPTTRSRCRLVTLATPTADDVAAFLVREDGVAEGLAAYAARASQGHIGRARALARDESTRNRRREVVTIPARLTSLGACMTAASNLAEVTKEEADLITSRLDEKEKADLDASYGVVERGRRPRDYAPALAALERAQKTRAKRRQLDVVDRGLMDLVSVYRDAIAEATGGRQRGPPDQVTHLVDADRELLGADQGDVGMGAGLDGVAGVTLVATAALALERRGQGDGGVGAPRPRRPGEEPRVGHPVATGGAAQCLDDRPLADQVVPDGHGSSTSTRAWMAAAMSATGARASSTT